MFLRRRHRLVRRIVLASAVAALAAPVAQAQVDPLGAPADSSRSFETPVARVAELRDTGERGLPLVVMTAPRSEVSSFDWASAGIGLGAGAALALAGGGLLAVRRRFGPSPIA
jgi:hypothetical protein